MLSTLLLSITLFARVLAAGLKYSVQIDFIAGSTDQAQAENWRDNITDTFSDSQGLSSCARDMDGVRHLLFYRSNEVRTFDWFTGSTIQIER